MREGCAFFRKNLEDQEYCGLAGRRRRCGLCLDYTYRNPDLDVSGLYLFAFAKMRRRIMLVGILLSLGMSMASLLVSILTLP